MYKPVYGCLNIAIDIETLGVNSTMGAPVTQIGAAYIGVDDLKTFSVNIDTNECEEKGLAADESTLEWVSKLPNEVYSQWFIDPVSIKEALSRLHTFISQARNDAEAMGIPIMVFGNSPRFDFNMIDHLFRVCGERNRIWNFREEGDYRTLHRIIPLEGSTYEDIEEEVAKKLGGEFKHTAVYDAVLELFVIQTISQRAFSLQQS